MYCISYIRNIGFALIAEYVNYLVIFLKHFGFDLWYNSADYCVEYSSANDLKPVIVFNGFTKGVL